MGKRARRWMLAGWVVLLLGGWGAPVADAQVPPWAGGRGGPGVGVTGAPPGVGVPGVAPGAPGVAPAAQGQSCQPAQLAGMTSNVDLRVRLGPGAARQVRLAGLQAWTEGWPLADTLPDRVASLAGRTPLCLTADGPDVAGAVPQRQAWLADGRTSLALLAVQRGWAQVADDAESSAPSAAAALRAAEAEARGANRGVWAVLARLVPYTTPSGDTARVDARATPALDVLAQLDAGRSLVDTLARGVVVFVMDEPNAVWAHYDGDARVIGVDTSLADVDPRTLAALLAHEATHALDDLDGLVSQSARRLGASGACYEDEYRASVAELNVWQQLYGSGGRQPARHPYERQTNSDLARFQRTPERYAARLVSEYTSECGR